MGRKKNQGFSLLELVVAISILAVLGGILLVGTGAIGRFKVREYTDILDSFMRKTRTDAMSKSNVCGIFLYQQNGRYYIESYGEEKAEDGTITYRMAERRELGSSSGVRITVSLDDDSRQTVLADNTGNTITSCFRVKYASGTGAVSDIFVNTDTESKMDYTKITVSRGEENSRWIEINPVTGKNAKN